MCAGGAAKHMKLYQKKDNRLTRLGAALDGARALRALRLDGNCLPEIEGLRNLARA